MNREDIENEAYKRYPTLHNHIVTEEEVQDAKWEGFVEGAEWMLKESAVVDTEGNPVTVETLKNACEIVRNTTKQKAIECFCQVCSGAEMCLNHDCVSVRNFKEVLG